MTRPHQARGGRRDCGSAAVELVLVAPVFIAFLLTFVFGGQLLLDRQQVGDIARTAAEAATDARSPIAASYSAEVTASSAALGDGLRCAALQTATDTAAFSPGGRVTVTVRCAAELGPLELLQPGSTVALEASSSAIVEPYRTVAP